MKYFLLILPFFLLTGCGNADIQKQKEIDVIEAQRQKEIDVLDHEQELRDQAAEKTQALIDYCIDEAQVQRKKALGVVLSFYGISPDATPEQMASEQEAYCQRKYRSLDALLKCTTTYNEQLKEIISDYKKAEADCYTRYK